jgi:hypothetical protein
VRQDTQGFAFAMLFLQPGFHHRTLFFC